MGLDDDNAFEVQHDAAGGAEGPHLRAAAPARLVLFVGTPPPAQLCELLAHDGMRSLWLAGPAQALRAGTLARFDALVIDTAQLGSRAAQWLADLHAQLGCPVVVVAEHADEIDEIVALELGADTYLARPLAARRLRAHLAALMRLRATARPESEPRAPPPGTVGTGWQLDRVANRLTLGGDSIALTEVQAALLQCLAEARGRIVPRARLAAALPHGPTLGARSVDVYIHRLRARLQREAGTHRLAIEAVRGRGYVLSGLGISADNAARDTA